MPCERHPAWSTVCRYLAASRPPADPAELHRLSAPDSLLIVGDFLQACKSIPTERYANAVGQLLALLPEGAIGPWFEPLDLLDGQSDDTGVSLLASLREGRTGKTVTAAFRLQGPEWRVYGGCLHDGPLPEPEVLQARILAELAHWHPEAGFPVWPLTGLGLSYYRLHEPLDRPLESLPEARFTCQGRGDCCRSSRWIDTSLNAQLAMNQVPWERLGLRGPAFVPNTRSLRGSPRAVTIVAGHEGCLALCDNRCHVHQAIGWQPIDPCMQYPYLFVVTPDAVCVTTSFTCRTVIDNVGLPLAAQADELRQRFQPRLMQSRTIGDTVLLSPAGPELTWAAYRAVETTLLAILADRERPMAERLRHGSEVVLALLAAFATTDHRLSAAEVAAVLARGGPPLPPGEVGQADALAAAALSTDDLDEDTDSLFSGGSLDAWHTGAGHDLSGVFDDLLVTRYLRTALFRKPRLELGSLAYSWGMIPWLWRAWQRDAWQRAKRDGRPLDRETQIGSLERLDSLHAHQPKRFQRLYPDTPFGALLAEPATWAGLLIP